VAIERDRLELKPLEWVGSSKEDLIAFPPAVRKALGYALYMTQIGEKAPAAKPLKGFGGAAVIEIVKDHDGNAYRAVYTVKFAGVVYVLHAFQKKSKKGSATPKSEIGLVRQRLKVAAQHYQQHYRENP
jgi:phage-related protein